jgi:hypothetical protein
MGLHDAQEMLDAAKAQSVTDERRITYLEAELAALEHEYVERGDRLEAVRDACDTSEADGHGDAVSIALIRSIVNAPEHP